MGKECCNSSGCTKKKEISEKLDEPSPGKKECCSESKKKEESSCCDSLSGKCSSKATESCGTRKVEEACCSSSSKNCDTNTDGHNHLDTSGVQSDSPPLCLAVVREDGADVVIFDASGVPRTFSYKGTGKAGDIRKLCFQTHGFDDLLTPCFDESGNHGSPEESCFCGVDTPHLHAHLRDPATCNDDDDDDAATEIMSEAKLGFLASQILHPTENEDPPVFHMEVTERMPNQCNFQEAARASSRSSSMGSEEIQLKKGTKRLHKVQHDDHVDYLMHNEETGELHLEHPCDSCGKDDVHGRFKAVGKRRIQQSGSDIQMHFFEVTARPFNVLDHLTDLFEVSSDRVNAVENILPQEHHHKLAVAAPKKPTIVRSTLKCTQICCAAEVSAIRTILEPVNGIEKIMINVPLKQVIVDHDASIITVTEIADHLNRQKFGATVLRDGGSDIQEAATTGRSQFYVGAICCASEIPAINAIIEPLSGVKSVSINTTTKTVYVDHNPSLLSAQQICDALNAEAFEAQVRVDAAETLQAASQSVFVISTLLITNNVTDSDTETLTTFLQTFVDASQMEKFVVDFPTKTITVVHNPFCLTAQRIADLLSERTQLEATVSTDGADPEIWKYPETLRDAAIDNMDGLDLEEKMTYPRPTVIISGLLWIISMLSLIGGKWESLKYVALVSVAFGIPPIAMKAFRTLRRCQFDTNCLMLFAAIGAVALQDFTEAAAVVFLFSLSEWLEVRATTRARHALAAIVQLRPENAYLLHPTTLELLEIPASLVPVGALVSVKTGDKIPCDGVVAEGYSTVDESSLTGESRPIRKGPNDKVAGGTINSGMSPLLVRTTSTSENSAVARLIRLVEEAQANRSETEKLVDEFAKVYTPVVVLAALLMCTIPWAFGKETGREWTYNGLILIVVACPCALIISTPVSYVAGLALAAQKGILVKGGADLEALAAVKRVCFDKTGTLTNGEFALLHMKVLTKDLTRNEVFQYLCLMEERASHPVAQAILTAAKNENVMLPKKMVLQKHTIINGEGVVGVIDGREVHVGNERMFIRLGLLDGVSESEHREVDEWKVLGGTVGYMSIEGHGIVCAYCAADGIRPESADVVEKLKKAGISTIMLTGDNDDAAQAIGRQVGLGPEDIKSRLLPEDKLHYVESLSEGSPDDSSALCNPFQRKRLTLMCGDGVNDAPALAAADVGVAMGEGAALSMETSDVTLLDSNLEKLVYSINIGKKVTWKIVQNVVFSLVVKFIVLGFALAGKTNLWAAVCTDVGAMLIVTLNSMLLLPRRQTHSKVENMTGDIEKASDIQTNRGLARELSENTDNCSEEAPSPKEAAIKPCARGCCGSDEVVTMDDFVEEKDCEKGCCDSKNCGSEEGTGVRSRGWNTMKPCAKGCCFSDFDKETREKGCCASEGKPSSSCDHLHSN